MSLDWCAYARTHLEGCIQIRIFTNSQWAPHLDERSSVLKESEWGGSWGMSVYWEEARKSKHLERQTQGYAPGEAAFASLTEMAKQANVQTPPYPKMKSAASVGMRRTRAEASSLFFKHSMIGFVFICTDQKHGCADTNFVREALLTAPLSCPQTGWESQCTAWGGVTGKSKHSTLMKHSSWLTSQLRGLIKVREERRKKKNPTSITFIRNSSLFKVRWYIPAASEHLLDWKEQDCCHKHNLFVFNSGHVKVDKR